VLVAVAAEEATAGAAAAELRALGATVVTELRFGNDRVVVHGGPFDDLAASQATAALRSSGWPAVTRPVEAGHLQAWQRHTRPINIADRLWVCFPWSEFDRSGPPGVVEIDPGRSFGTGGHPSTTLLLRELAHRINGGERVLDVGCGSGVLALSAARLGAASVHAVDVAADAVMATRANAHRNHLATTIDAWSAPVSDLRGEYDVVVANIGAPTLISLAPALLSLLAPGGWLGLSGMSPAQTSVVLASYPGLQVLGLPSEDDWTAIVANLARVTGAVPTT
jgi:ribosomal protein L11 methyltransferase